MPSRARLPVVLFFVLSGFILARSLARNDDVSRISRQGIQAVPGGDRGAPCCCCTVLHEGVRLYLGFEPDFSPFNVMLNALMIRHDINGPMWSMTVERFATRR